MKKYISLFALLSLAFHVNGADMNTYDGTSFSATYNTQVRVTQGFVNQYSTAISEFSRNINFDSSGNVLVGAGSSGASADNIYLFSSTLGLTTSKAANGASRSVAESGGYYFYYNGTELRSLNNGTDWSTATDAQAVSGTLSSPILTMGGSYLYVSDSTSVKRYSVSGGTLTLQSTLTGATAASIRSMSYNSTDQRLYLYDSSRNLNVIDTSGNNTAFSSQTSESVANTSALSGAFNAEGMAFGLVDGKKFIFAADSLSGGTHGISAFQLTDYKTAQSTFDFYAGTSVGGSAANYFNDDYNNDAATAIGIRGSTLYVGWNNGGAGGTIQSFSLTTVPEPHEYALMILGGLVLAIAIYRKRQQNAVVTV